MKLAVPNADSVESNPAVILCGGRGSRLGALSNRSPKCLLKVGGSPILFHHLDSYESAGVCDTYLALGYLSARVREAISARRGKSRYHLVEAPDLGTGGSLLKVLRLLPLECQYFWVSMGDIVCSADLSAMWKRAQETGAQAVILGTRVTNPAPYGALICDSKGWLLDFKEKAVSQGPALIDAGFYLFRRDFLSEFEQQERLSLEYQVFPHASSVAVVEHIGPWYDVGTVHKLRAARRGLSLPSMSPLYQSCDAI